MQRKTKMYLDSKNVENLHDSSEFINLSTMITFVLCKQAINNKSINHPKHVAFHT